MDWTRQDTAIQQIFVSFGKKKQSTREYFILFSVTKLVGDLENSLAENFDSKEKIEALENVIQDFLLLRKLSAKFQSNQASLLENGR